MDDDDIVTYKDIRTGQWIVVDHEFPAKPPLDSYSRRYVGKVTEVSQKWLRVVAKKNNMIVPEQPAAKETIYVIDKKTAEAMIKEMK